MLATLLNKIPDYHKQIPDLLGSIIANTVMVGELPAPTFKENSRIEYLKQQFNEAGLQNISTDEVGNGVGLLQGYEGKKNLLLVAHADSPFTANIPHSFSIDSNSARGPGIGDNALGLGFISCVPFLLEKLNLRLQNNLILMGSTRSLGHGNLQGIRFFLENTRYPIEKALVIEGVHQGRLSYSSLGVLRGEISCHVPTQKEWDQFLKSNAITTLSAIIRHIEKIPIEGHPQTSIILGSISGGTSYTRPPAKSKLKFEIRSQDSTRIKEIRNRLDDIIQDIATKTGHELLLEIIAERGPGTLEDSDPLVCCTQDIMRSLDIVPRIAPSTGELSALLDKKIAAVTLGLTHGHNIHEDDESIELEPLLKGVMQVILLLEAVDKNL